MTEVLQPFVLEPVLVERPWGGRRLEAYGKRLPEGRRIGESWEVADLADETAPDVTGPRSTVASGPLRGTSLSDVVAHQREAILGKPVPRGDRFPLLIKLLDATEPLSVQVHPSAIYAADHPSVAVKTESWFVMAAEPGASMYLGVRPGVTLEEIREAFGTTGLLAYLNEVPAVVGAFHHLPAGLVHALGAGVVVAEVQTPSDTTFRLYDWSAEYGRAPRPLHRTEALASIDLSPVGAMSLTPVDDWGSRGLIDSTDYRIVEHRTPGGLIELWGSATVRIVMVMGGSIEVAGLTVEEGATVIVPASATDRTIEASGAATLLEIAPGG